MPDWLTGLGGAQLDPAVWFMTHVLGDGDDYLLGGVIATANRIVGSYRSPMTGKNLLAPCGIAGSVSDRAQRLVRAAGIDLRLTYGSLRVGDRQPLVSRRRRELIDERDRALAGG